jgi:hypothetical protein
MRRLRPSARRAAARRVARQGAPAILTSGHDVERQPGGAMLCKCGWRGDQITAVAHLFGR